MNKFKDYIPLIISLGVLGTIIIIVLVESLDVTGGKFIYVLDDVYIHLAFAKNIVLNNVAGITQYESSSSSSSPLWTLILIFIFYLTGVNEFIPLLLNILFSFVLISLIFLLFKKYLLSNIFSTIALLTIIILTPFSLHLFSGMEHLLQTIFVLLFIYLSVKELTKPQSSAGKIKYSDIFIFILSALLVSIRYEDIIIVFVISALFLFRKKYLKAFLIIIFGIMPVLIYGLISINNGGYFIPNSILIKITLPESVTIFTEGNVFKRILNYIHYNRKLISLFIISVSIFILQIKLKKNFLSEIPLLLFIIISIILLHKFFLPASYFRYDVYLLITVTVINAIAIYDYVKEKYKIKIDFAYIRKNKIALVFFIIISISLLYKTFDFEKTILASRNIYEQQYQMSRFVNKYYNGSEVALNDIGAVNFFADIRCLDFIGIGTNEVVKKRLDGNFNPGIMNEIAKRRNVKIAIVYDKWFDYTGGIPDGWSKAGEWKIQDNYICGEDAVTFYAITPDELFNLRENLKSFSTELPASIIQSGEYLEND